MYTPTTCARRRRNPLLDVVRQVEDVEKEVSPGHTGDASEEEAPRELRPSVGSLELIRRLLSSGQSQRRRSGRVSLLEGGDAVHGEADAEDDDEAGGGEGASGAGDGGVAERAGLDEGAHKEVAVGQADLDAAEEGADRGAVGGEVGEVPGDEWAGGYWSL